MGTGLSREKYSDKNVTGRKVYGLNNSGLALVSTV